jgi:hypothetical protein
MVTLGEQISATIDTLRKRGFVVERRSHGGDTVFAINAPKYHAIVTLNPARWVGLHFALGPSGHKSELALDIDTDLFDVANPRFDKLALAVEEKVCAFLTALAAGEVLVGRVGRQPALLAPLGQRTMVITPGTFGRAAKVRRAGAGLEAKGGFVPFHPPIAPAAPAAPAPPPPIKD